MIGLNAAQTILRWSVNVKGVKLNRRELVQSHWWVESVFGCASGGVWFLPRDSRKDSIRL